jgi:diguanylate cyclase (GGDEF)-like protein
VPPEFLTEVLAQSEHVNELISQAVDAMRVDTATGRALSNAMLPPEGEKAVDQSETVRRKLQQASEQLAAVNRALADAVRARSMVDHQLAAALEQEAGARNAALHDNLTGLPNRALFNDRIEHGIAQARRHRWGLAVIFIDVDKFKDINDTYGHLTGDAVLQTISDRLKHSSRDEDTVSRYGGDEFLYLLTNVDDTLDIKVVVEKILKAIRAPCFVNVRDVSVTLGLEVSIGISMFPKDGATSQELITNADRAMYRAKQSRSGYAFAG